MGMRPSAYFTTPGVGGTMPTNDGQPASPSLLGGTAAGSPDKASSGHYMTHPQLGTVRGPQAMEEEDKQALPYPVYIRPYDDELPQVTWRKNPLEPFGTLTIVKGEDKMIVKVPMKDDRVLPKTNYPVELATICVFAMVAFFIWKVL